MSRQSELQHEVDEIGQEILRSRGRAKAILNKADAENRDLTPEEDRASNRLHTEIDRLLAMRDTADQNLADEVGREGRRSAGRQTIAEMPLGSAGLRELAPMLAGPSARSRDLFAGPRPSPYGAGAFSSLGEFVKTVALNGNDPRLQITNAMDESIGSAGGALVPEEWAFGILDQALAAEAIRPRATVLPMSTNVLNCPGFDYLDGSGGKRAGLVLTWTGESSTLTEQTGKTRNIGLVAKKGTILVRLSTELMEDAASFNVALTNAFSQAVQIGLDIAFLNGTGAGQPLGIVNSPAAITVAKTSGQVTLTLSVANLAAMLGRLAPSSFGKAVWFVHPTVLPALYAMVVQIYNLALTDVVGGSLVGAVTQADDGSLRIFGMPVVITEACSTFTSAGDVVLADCSQYLIGLRRDFSVEMSNAPYFTTDEIGIRCRLRLDGQPIPSTPIKLRDGVNTVSPFVVLGAR